MTDLVFLHVPFKDKDKVKSLGAKWHSDRKQWFLSAGQDTAPFTKWIPEYETEFTDRAIAPFYLLKSKEDCWKCHKKSEVITFAASGLEGDFSGPVKFSYVSVLPRGVKAFVEKYYKHYFIDYSNTTQSHYYINHCEHCHAPLGDFYMHMEPDHAFFPMSDREAAEIEVIELKSNGYVKISAEESIGTIDSILKYGKKSVFIKPD